MRRDLLTTAACRSASSELTALFFSEDFEDLARAKSICARCPVARDCLADALARGEPAGVWGGKELRNGVVRPVHRRRGRPGKVTAGVGC